MAMKISNKALIIGAGALIVIGIVIYGSKSLYSKLNKVDELHVRLEEAAAIDAGQKSIAGTEQTPEAEPTQSPELEPSTQPKGAPPSAAPAPTAALAPGPASDNVENGHTTKNEPQSLEDKAHKKKEIDASVTAALLHLKSSCQASSSRLARQIAEELSGDGEVTLAAIQSKYLNKIFAAEAACDAKFNQLISNARSEYKAADLGHQALPDWGSQYESAKAKARGDALAVIANSLN